MTTTTRSISRNCRSPMPPDKGTQYVLGEQRGRREQRAGGGGQDRREQRAEEQHLRPERRALEDEVRQDALDLARVLAGEERLHHPGR